MKILWLFLLPGIGALSMNVRAGDELNDQLIRDKVQRGEILSLDRILQLNPALSGQRLLDLEVEIEHGDVVYELEFLQPDGAVNKLLIDASSGKTIIPEKEDDR